MKQKTLGKTNLGVVEKEIRNLPLQAILTEIFEVKVKMSKSTYRQVILTLELI